MTDQTKATNTSKRVRKIAREPQPAANADNTEPAQLARAEKPNEPALAAPASKLPTKGSTILALLQRSEGATLEQLVDATGWLPHTTRAALTGIKRRGHVLTSEKVDGVRTYRISNESPSA